MTGWVVNGRVSKQSLSIAQVCADRGIAPGSTKGASQHLRGIAAGLSAAGHRVTTFSSRPPDGSYPVAVIPLADLGNAGHLDLLYERYSLGHLGGLTQARRRGVPFVLEVNAPLSLEAKRYRPETLTPTDRAVEKRLLAEADLVIAVSSGLAEWVNLHRDGPTVVLTNGFEPSWFPVPAGSPTQDEATLVFLGHPKPWHGANRLAFIVAELIKRQHHVRLKVVGGGPGVEPLLAAACRLGVLDRIDVTGPLPPEEASAALVGATVALAPYPEQAPFYFCPLKIVDYLAAGLPIVSTDQGDVADMVGDAGVVVKDANDDLAFVDAVAALLGDRDVRRRMSAVGRRRAFASMTWNQVAARTLVAIEEVAAASRSVASRHPMPGVR